MFGIRLSVPFIILIFIIGIVQPVMAQNCEDIYIIRPDNNEGGTFYLGVEPNPVTGTRLREGYLPTMTLIKVVRRQDGNRNIIPITEKKWGDRFDYIEFIGSDGSHGFVKLNLVRQLNDLFKRRQLSFNCKSDLKLIIPTSPTEEVVIYNRPSDTRETPVPIGRFSRSFPEVVLTDETTAYWENADHSGQAAFYNVTYSRKMAGGGFRQTDALIEARGHGQQYKISTIDPAKYVSIAQITDETMAVQVVNFIKRWFEGYDDAKLVRAFQKPCDMEYVISARVQASVGMPPLKFIEIGADGSMGINIKFSSGFRYSLERYRGFFSGKTREVLKTIRCESNSTSDWYTDHLTVTQIGKDNQIFEIFQHQLEKRFAAYFETPDTTGFAGITRDKMIVLKKIETGDNRDYFTAFSKLQQYLNERLFKHLNLNSAEEDQLKSLIIRLMVDCNY